MTATSSQLRRLDVRTGKTDAFHPQHLTLRSPGVWKGIVVERWQGSGTAETLEETVLNDHVIALNLGQPADYEISWSGQAARRRRCNVGEFALLPAQHPYHAVTYSGWDGIIVGMDKSIFDAAVLGSNSVDRLEITPHVNAADGLVYQISLALLQDAADGCPCGPAYGETLAVTLAAQLCRAFGQIILEPTSPALGLSQIQMVQDYVESNLERAIHLRELAVITGMSLYCFARAFKAATTESPHRYITGRRIAAAKRLLAGSNLSLVDISLRCGFSSQSHFGNVFARDVKVTPSQFRKSLGMKAG